MRIILAILLAMAVAGCATAGRQVKPEQLQQLQRGTTTVDEAVGILGAPTQRTLAADGSTVLIYSYAHVQTRPETYIPVVGAFVGGADTRTNSAVLMFDRGGILRDYTASEGASGMGHNMSAGSPKARVPDQPAEAHP